jgi:hypothetical protein
MEILGTIIAVVIGLLLVIFIGIPLLCVWLIVQLAKTILPLAGQLLLETWHLAEQLWQGVSHLVGHLLLELWHLRYFLLAQIALLVVCDICFWIADPVRFARNLGEVQGMLFSRIPLIGGRRRRLARLALLENGSPEAVGLLAQAVTNLDYQLNQHDILGSLEQLSERGGIDAVCKVWAATRHADLTPLLTKKDWVAEFPMDVRVLSALKVGKLEVVTEGGTEIAETLVKAFSDTDREIAERANQYAIALTNPDAIDYLCDQWAKDREGHLEQVILQGNYVAQQPINARLLSALKTGNRQIIASNGAEMIASLLQACDDADPKIATEAIALLGELQNQLAIDALCQEWVNTRSERLTEALLRGQYVAASPIEVRVLTALKTRKRQIIVNDEVEIVATLLQACEDVDSQIAAEATALLGELQNQQAIDVLCREWAKTRTEKLTGALQRRQYVAASPIEVRVLTALKTGKRQIIARNGAEMVAPLLQACEDADSKIATEATALLGELQNQQAINVLCQEWAKTRSIRLTEVLLRGQYVAASPTEVKVLTALKTGQRQIITNDEEVKFIVPLLQACEDADSQIAAEATALLGKLQNQRAIDALCQEWEKNRSARLTQALQQGRYVATYPAEVRVLTALKSERLEAITGGGAELVEQLLQASRDKDPDIADRGQLALQQLKNPEAQESLCQLLIEQDHQIALKVAVAAQYAPRDPNQRALFYFLTEQWDKYESLDFEHTMLETAYKVGGERVRKRITDKARQAGRIELVRILVGGLERPRLGELTDAEWETTLAVLSSGEHWKEMWGLAQTAPAVWTLQLLQRLKQVKWVPKQDEERTVFVELQKLAQNCVGEAPKSGELGSDRTMLSNLIRLPVGQMSLEDMAWVQARCPSELELNRRSRLAKLGVKLPSSLIEISDAELSWLKFLQALINLRRRFDIEVEDTPKRIDAGEFDIEIEA